MCPLYQRNSPDSQLLPLRGIHPLAFGLPPSPRGHVFRGSLIEMTEIDEWEFSGEAAG
jgi:hypothetical protein